jgi:hypothetical protein
MTLMGSIANVWDGSSACCPLHVVDGWGGLTAGVEGRFMTANDFLSLWSVLGVLLMFLLAMRTCTIPWGTDG